uniref:Uncharacterized protein n=4 Tax=Trichobilharzia regenti TaxID=157069 RepID=A0AA85K4Q3_TRIRE|nr:unnamed protein product [Trichobilharzia regenti]CAH8820637.1 unnamed protein product [Trichobilharzia regenti]CAH8837774.1 unnamed protein product [Trichobilharzia regenti]CAH8839246.1 unnamed protein product [Trichobilharzia regenti]CAH8853654.1 unnamed protein product [Trichobilharzia regenti]
MVQISKKRVRRNTIVLDSGLNSVITALPPRNTVSTTSSQNGLSADLTPVIQVKDVLLENSEFCKLNLLLKDMQRQVSEIQKKLDQFDSMSLPISNTTESRSDIGQVKCLLDVTQNKLLNLDPIACLLERHPKISPDNLNKAENLIDCLATEVMKRITSSHQAIVYNVPDSLPLKTVRHKILICCGMASVPCECKRLRKKSNQANCPIIFKFSNSLDASKFTKCQDHLRLNSSYKSITVAQDKTPCQRRIMRSNNLVTSSSSSFDLPNKDRAQQQTPSAETSIQQTTQQPHLPMELGTDLDTSTPVNKASSKDVKMTRTSASCSKKFPPKRSNLTTMNKFRRVETNDGEEYFVFNKPAESKNANKPSLVTKNSSRNISTSGGVPHAPPYRKSGSKTPKVLQPKHLPSQFPLSYKNNPKVYTGMTNSSWMGRPSDAMPFNRQPRPNLYYPYIQEHMVNFPGVLNHWYDPWHLGPPHCTPTPMCRHPVRPPFHS